MTKKSSALDSGLVLSIKTCTNRFVLSRTNSAESIACADTAFKGD